MRSFFARWLGLVAAGALALAALAPAFAAGDPPMPPDFEGDGVGHSPSTAFGVIGTMRSMLPPGVTVWYQVTSGAAPPLGVAVNYFPTNAAATGAIQMHVDWITASGKPDLDWPGYYRIGEGTSSGLAQGTLYWATSDHATGPYWIELVNNSTTPIGYAIALTGHQYPPPALSPPGP
jgi:hypothetical protein